MKNIISWETASPEPDPKSQELANKAAEEDRAVQDTKENNRKVDEIR